MAKSQMPPNLGPKLKTRTAAKATPSPKPKVPKSAPYEEGKWAEAFSPRAPGEKRYWLVKSEPSVYSFDHLWASPAKTTFWDGIRNFAARNFLRDGMKKGDLVFFYHSMDEPQAIAGICEVVREGYPDFTATDPDHEYFDPKSDVKNPTWFLVDVRAIEKFAKPVLLSDLKSRPELSTMALLRVGRLSVSPVTASEWEAICKIGREKAR